MIDMERCRLLVYIKNGYKEKREVSLARRVNETSLYFLCKFKYKIKKNFLIKNSNLG